MVVIISNYIFKAGFEAVATPVTYAVVGFLKKNEKVDAYDYKTNFNPFVEFWNARPRLESSTGEDGG